jgi:hypothetical protein
MAGYQDEPYNRLCATLLSRRLLALYTEARAAAEEHGYLHAAAIAKRAHAAGLELFGDVDSITCLVQVFISDLLARAGQPESASTQFAQAINALIFKILLNPNGDEDACQLIHLLFDTALSDPIQEPLPMRFDKFGANLKAISNIATSLHEAQPVQACLLLTAVFGTWKRFKGADDDETLLLGHKLGLVLQRLGQYEVAVSLAKDVFSRRLQRYGFDHTLTLRAAGAYTSGLFKLGYRDQAIDLQRQVYDAARRLHGDEHDQTRIALNNLVSMQERR